MREWNGVTQVVEVLPEGFMWRGASYRTLSAVACAITGTKWSGPKFFGLDSSAGAPSKAGERSSPRLRTGAAAVSDAGSQS